MVGVGVRNMDTKGDWMFFGVALTKFLRCLAGARTLNWTSLPPSMGCEILIVTA